MSETLPITGIPRNGLPPLALVTGDPQRIRRIGELLDGARQVASSREYVTCTGRWKGTDVVVSSHGVGAPGAVLLFHELAQAGVTAFVRAGTCGALQDGIDDGDLIVATDVVREDGVTDQMVTSDYAAAADPGILDALHRAAKEIGHPVHLGTVVTSSLFFPGTIESSLPRHAADGVIGVEMELAALLVTASLKGLRAGGVLVVDGNPLRTPPESYDPHRDVVHAGVDAAFRVALDALHEVGR